jgi:hypothetical protein
MSTSGENFDFLMMAPSSQMKEPQIPGRFKQLRTKGSWVRILSAAPNSTSRSKSFLFLWDCCATCCPQRPVALRFRDHAATDLLVIQTPARAGVVLFLAAVQIRSYSVARRRFCVGAGFGMALADDQTPHEVRCLTLRKP